MKRLVFGGMMVGLLAASMCLTTDAAAGMQGNAFASCGQGGCSGTMIGFRNSANPNDVALFITTGAGVAEFYASFNGSGYSCYVPSGSPLLSEFSSAILAHSYFDVEWNTSTGQCTYLGVTNESDVSDSW
jgi:hypothetical protein